MEFATAAHKACYEKVSQYMKELFGEFANVRSDKPMFGLVMGSAFAQIAVFPWGDDDAVVSARCYVVMGAECTLELTRQVSCAGRRRSRRGMEARAECRASGVKRSPFRATPHGWRGCRSG